MISWGGCHCRWPNATRSWLRTCHSKKSVDSMPRSGMWTLCDFAGVAYLASFSCSNSTWFVERFRRRSQYWYCMMSSLTRKQHLDSYKIRIGIQKGYALTLCNHVSWSSRVSCDISRWYFSAPVYYLLWAFCSVGSLSHPQFRFYMVTSMDVCCLLIALRASSSRRSQETLHQLFWHRCGIASGCVEVAKEIDSETRKVLSVDPRGLARARWQASCCSCRERSASVAGSKGGHGIQREAEAHRGDGALSFLSVVLTIACDICWFSFFHLFLRQRSI